MASIKLMILTFSCLFASLVSVVAAEDRKFTFSEWGLVLLPLAALIALMFWTPRRMHQWGKNLTQRTDQHYERVEAYLERIASALERLEKKDKD